VQEGLHFCSGLQLHASPHGQVGEHPQPLDCAEVEADILENEVMV
jgi:hypothetical protein